MPRATFRFYASLNDFLPHARRGVDFAHVFNGRASLKDMIESLGVPHTEVDLVLVNGDPAGFEAIVQDGDRISVYPTWYSLDVSGVTRVRPAPPDGARFVLDVHLGKLAVYLRLLGFDALFPEDYDDANLARIARDEGRILLTRDRGLLKRGMVTHGFCPRTTNSRQQLQDVLRRFDLFDHIAPFTRCLRCNGLLEPVDKAAIHAELPAHTRDAYEEFKRCANCGQLFWKGSHYAHMARLVESARLDSGGAEGE